MTDWSQEGLKWIFQPGLPDVIGDEERCYLRPLGFSWGLERAFGGIRLAGTGAYFHSVALIRRRGGTARVTVEPVAAFERWLDGLPKDHTDSLARPWQSLSCLHGWVDGTALTSALVMGIVNVTPDSFSDGGDHPDAESAIQHGYGLIRAGADVIDIGGESTRPGARPVSPDEEQARVLPVIRALDGHYLPLSVDTRNAETMRRALAAGAWMVNDVSALRHDPEALSVVADRGVPVILMHSRASPETMREHTRYAHPALDVYDALAERISAVEAAGIARDRILVDPGIGFAKTPRQSHQILRWLALFHGLGCPIVVGASRKSFIGTLSGEPHAKRRLPGSIAAALMAVERGAHVLRVHDVWETRQALAVMQGGR